MPDTDLSSFPIVDETGLYNANLMIEKAAGHYIWFEGDSVPYFDLVMGYSSTNFGHNNPDIIRYIQKALQKGDNTPAFNFRERISLSKKLLDYLPFDNNNYQIYYPVGGAKAVETALKLAMLHTQKTKVISFRGGFHGYSKGAMSVTDQQFFNHHYSMFNHEVVLIEFPDINKTSDYKEALDQLRDAIQEEPTAAVIIEPIQGASGFRQAHKKFFQSLRKITQDHNIILILDEIQSGIGRTGEFYAFSKFSIQPDIVLLGKSLAGGFYPLSAVISKREYFDSVGNQKTGFDSTFSNNLFGIGIADKVMTYIKETNLLQKVQHQEKLFTRKMTQLKEKYSFIKNISVIGLACAWELVDNATAQKVKQQAFQDHIIIQTAGIEGNYIKISPALTITDQELKLAISQLDASLSRINLN